MRWRHFSSARLLAYALSVAMLVAAAPPCAQAEEQDVNTSDATVQSDNSGESSNSDTQDNQDAASAGEDAGNASSMSSDAQIAGRTVENIDKGWSFSKNDSSMAGWTFRQALLMGI